MIFSCEKALLQEAVATASRAVATKSTIPALEGLLLHCCDGVLTVSGYNMQTGIRTSLGVESSENGAIVLSSRLFGDIIRRMPDDVITFTSNEKLMVHLACGDAFFDIIGLSAEDFPDLPEVEENFSLSIPETKLHDMIEQTGFAVSTNEARPIHMGVLFEVNDKSLTMVAVDGFRLALRHEELEKSEGGSFSFVAPGTALNEVKNICGVSDEPVSVTLGERHILFELGSTELICRRLEGDFLDYKNAIPRRNPTVVTVEKKNLLESLDRVSVVISEKLKSPVRFVFEKDRIQMSANTSSGDAKDVCRMEGDGGGLEIGFNNRYLMEALRYAPAESVRIELNTGISPAIIVPTDGEENFIYMVLPIRLKTE